MRGVLKTYLIPAMVVLILLVIALAGCGGMDSASTPGWREIYETYPSSAGGKEVAYRFLDTVEMPIADDMLQDIFHVPRFNPVKITPLTWQEDPYGEKYWQFVFYSLRPTRHLLNAWWTTGDDRYRLKLLDIIESFIDRGMEGPFSWDLHGAAWRTMVLVDTWWKLREKNGLPEKVGLKMLEALKVHGDFLKAGKNYQPEHNHGVNQAAALYVLAVNFPDIPGADRWLSIASRRLSKGINRVVDPDGILVENSPYYHFYTLRLYWDIAKYLRDHDLHLEGGFIDKVDKMISYGVYILQPDSGIPTLGASLAQTAELQGVYREMADGNPHFRYVLSRGEDGTAPPLKNVHYPEAGQTIMRSGWSVGDDFRNQTQVIFDVGSYRTKHSDLDALSFQLFGRGIALLPDAGLYTYESGPWHRYFHGTLSHNTVVVDGQDQYEPPQEGLGGFLRRTLERLPCRYWFYPKKVFVGKFSDRGEVVYQSAKHILYKGVIHRRAIALLGTDLVLIIDNLVSKRPHTYDQKFILFPEADLSINGLLITAAGDQPEQKLTIRQLLPGEITLKVAKGETDPIDGFRSKKYEVAEPCYALSYSQWSAAAYYVTLLEIGDIDGTTADIDETEKQITLSTTGGAYTFTYDLSADFSD